MPDIFENIYSVVKQIPKDKVATYKQIAKICGYTNDTFTVAWVLLNNPDPNEIPSHRVVCHDGGIKTQKMLLELDGINISKEGKVNLSVYQWNSDKDIKLLASQND